MVRNPKIETLASRRAVLASSLPKTTWHPLSLQQLNSRQFIEVVNGILDGSHDVHAGSLRSLSVAAAERELALR